eukprot:CAMPEP_0113513164 /NCGR_PEP_ID=MMETSP0014_2-20120614/39711_1 /TAXON_ID=2857 /ORGANISM="Nitzschia sp." /LENGTH=953 /DNA_ID=CAMNT_0000409539 /DNA_START=280 /DNA_END=3141 /DNA_ORIENTATION=- /assembly_acc=CAM_ASM_000159
MSDTGAAAEPDKGPGLGGIGESQSFDVSNDTSGSEAGSRVARDRRRYSLDDVNIVAEEEEQGGGAGEEDSVSEAANSRDQSESEDDEEIRLAKEMALAIAQNPNMTPDELKKLQEKSRKKASVGGAGKKMKRAVKKSIKVGVKGVAKGASKVKGKVKGAVSSSFSNKSGGGGKDSVPSTPSESGGGAPLSINTETPSPVAAGGRNRMKSADSTSSGVLDAALSAREHFASTDGTPAAASGAPSIRMTGIVWKRRSGFGKYSSHAAWERRRVILQGTRLVYFKTNMDSKDDDGSQTDANDAVEDLQHQGSAASDDEQLFMPTPTADVGGSGGPMSFLPFRHGSLTTPSNNDNARGGIDLLKDQASISASYGHSGAPTPFALSIKVMSQTKWKLCFDTHQELMQWLGAMTDVVVEGSVDAYNAQILEQHDPTHGAGANYGQLSEPPKGLAASDDVTTSDAAGHRLWAPGNYHVRSENYSADIIPEDELEEVNSDDDDDDDVVVLSKAASGNVLVAGAPPEIDFVIDPSTGTDFWGIPASRLFPAIVLLNAALCLSRVSSLSSDFFWHLLTFVNVALVAGLSKEKVGGKVLPKGTASSRNYVRRLSSGIAVSEPDDALIAAVDASKRGARKVKEDAKIPEPSEQDYKPIAGTTTMKIKNPTDLPVNKEGVIFGGWKSGDSTIMNIRSVGYKKHKEKVPSPGEMYECINVDIFESRTRFPDMASRVTLPTVEFKDDKGPKTWNAPDLFVISIAIPTDPPKLYGNTENGGGYTITMYYAMKKETRDILRRVTADGYDPSSEPNGDDPNKTQVNAVRLLDEWCRRAPTDDAFMARFKVVPNAQNLKEIGLPSWISKYNGKPFLIKRPGQTGFMYRHPDKSCIEFDISLHPFPYLAKQGICFMKEAYFKKVLVTFGFLVEGRSDDELPECLIGLFQLCYPDPVHAIQGEDFFAGKSPRSF